MRLHGGGRGGRSGGTRDRIQGNSGLSVTQLLTLSPELLSLVGKLELASDQRDPLGKNSIHAGAFEVAFVAPHCLSPHLCLCCQLRV